LRLDRKGRVETKKKKTTNKKMKEENRLQLDQKNMEKGHYLLCPCTFHKTIRPN
jgi:hypothetical protein